MQQFIAVFRITNTAPFTAPELSSAYQVIATYFFCKKCGKARSKVHVWKQVVCCHLFGVYLEEAALTAGKQTACLLNHGIEIDYGTKSTTQTNHTYY